MVMAEPASPSRMGKSHAVEWGTLDYSSVGFPHDSEPIPMLQQYVAV